MPTCQPISHRFRGAGRRAALALSGLALIVLTGAAQADGTVYKWTDAQGRVHYSDRPPADADAKAVPINTGYNHAAAHAQAASPHTDPQARAPGNAPANVPATTAEKKVAADLAAAHADDCKKAKATYDNYIRVRHLYKQDDAGNGEKVFLSDAQIEQARVDALREMTDACGGGGGEP